MPTTRLIAAGTVRGVFFSLGTTPSADPQLDCVKAIVDLFNASKKTVHVAIYTFTEARIADAMMAARKRGVRVSVVADATQSDPANIPTQAKIIEKLIAAKVDVRVTTKQKALMHNKVAIFDGLTVCTGSFNWTARASRGNDENLVVLDGKEIAAAYEKFVFQRIWKNETTVKAIALG